MENLGLVSPRKDPGNVLRGGVTPKQPSAAATMPLMPELTTEIKSSIGLLPGCVAQELSPPPKAPLKDFCSGQTLQYCCPENRPRTPETRE